MEDSAYSFSMVVSGLGINPQEEVFTFGCFAVIVKEWMKQNAINVGKSFCGNALILHITNIITALVLVITNLDAKEKLLLVMSVAKRFTNSHAT